MPVYINTSDTLKDFFEREAKANDYCFNPMILSKWFYIHRNDSMMEKYNPDLMFLLKKVTKIVPEASQMEIMTELISTANKVFDEHYSKKFVYEKINEWTINFCKHNKVK